MKETQFLETQNFKIYKKKNQKKKKKKLKKFKKILQKKNETHIKKKTKYKDTQKLFFYHYFQHKVNQNMIFKKI